MQRLRAAAPSRVAGGERAIELVGAVRATGGERLDFQE
jgi:hypothetical protein